MGKRENGILNPIAPVAAADKSGVGSGKVKKANTEADKKIDMDLYKTE